jgi:hypothetical protein
VKHYSPGANMAGCNLHGNDIVLGFGVYCQIAKNVEPPNSLAQRTRAASLGTSGNLTGSQLFLALDTGAIVTRHQWVVLPMPPLVIDQVNFLGWCEPSNLTFTNSHGQNIGDNLQDADSAVNKDEESIVKYPTDTPGVGDEENAELTGVDLDFAVKPTGVEMDSEAQGYVPEAHNEIDGLRQ